MVFALLRTKHQHNIVVNFLISGYRHWSGKDDDPRSDDYQIYKEKLKNSPNTFMFE